jgi:hypothetical protein
MEGAGAMTKRKHQLRSRVKEDGPHAYDAVDTQRNVSNARNKRRRIVALSSNIIFGLLFVFALLFGQRRPQTPFVQVCPHDLIDFRHGECGSVVWHLGPAPDLPGFADLDLLVNNGLPFGSTTLRFRVYKGDASGDHLYGTAMTSDLDPTWKAMDWSLQDLWDTLTLAEGTGSAPTPPAPGQYRIEVLDHAGRYLTETRLTLPWSPNDHQIATPVDQTGS